MQVDPAIILQHGCILKRSKDEEKTQDRRRMIANGLIRRHKWDYRKW